MHYIHVYNMYIYCIIYTCVHAGTYTRPHTYMHSHMHVHIHTAPYIFTHTHKKTAQIPRSSTVFAAHRKGQYIHSLPFDVQPPALLCLVGAECTAFLSSSEKIGIQMDRAQKRCTMYIYILRKHNIQVKLQ